MQDGGVVDDLNVSRNQHSAEVEGRVLSNARKGPATTTGELMSSISVNRVSAVGYSAVDMTALLELCACSYSITGSTLMLMRASPP